MVVREREDEWFDPMEIEFHNNFKRKSLEETEDITAMTKKDSFELHVQKVLKTGSTVNGHVPGNTGKIKRRIIAWKRYLAIVQILLILPRLQN